MYNLPLACMGKVTGEKIGSYVGLVEELDVYDGDTGWGEYLRAKIVIDMTKPLGENATHSRSINLGGFPV